jgi:hypothetical protein
MYKRIKCSIYLQINVYKILAILKQLIKLIDRMSKELLYNSMPFDENKKIIESKYLA